MCIHIHIYIYIYIIGQPGRRGGNLGGGLHSRGERRRDTYMYIYIYIHTHTHTYIYIYIYIHIVEKRVWMISWTTLFKGIAHATMMPS